MCGSPWQPDAKSTSAGSSSSAAPPIDAIASSNNTPLTPVEEAQEGNTHDDVNRRGFLGIAGGLPAQDVMNLPGRFNFRKKNSDVSERYSPITMRDIFARGRAPPMPDQELPWEPLKSFEGRWIVSVVPEPVESKPPNGIIDTESQPAAPDSTSKQRSETEQKPSSLLGEDLPAYFRIKVRQVDKQYTESSSEKLCRLGDVFELFTQVSEGIERVAAQLLQVDASNTQLAYSERENVVDKLVVGGIMLGGILDTDARSNILDKTRNYQADVLEGFLNSVLECPMPAGTLGSLAEVLGICASTKDALLVPPQTEYGLKNVHNEATTLQKEARKKGDESFRGSPPKPERMLSLISTCGAQMLRAEHSGPRLVNVQSKIQQKSESLPNPAAARNDAIIGSPLLSDSVQEELRRSMHDALIEIMAERDSTNAQMIGRSYLHSHELEHEKRKNRLLELELEVLRRFSQTNQPSGNLFGGQLAANAPHKDLEAKVKKLQLENSDDMMVALSQQLGVEIHAKTELEAEIKRMKESEKLKSENETSENEALKQELKRVKDLLASEERSKQIAVKEVEDWKASYERLKAERGEK